MTQTFTSSATSINRSKLPAVYGKAPLRSRVVLDYGCGKYTDHIRASLPNKLYMPYDPYNQPDEVNQKTMRFVSQTSCPVDVICSNVLNVIDSDEVIRSIVNQIETIVYRTHGTAYVTVYEGDRSGRGRQTGADQYQRNEPLRKYLRFFRLADIHNGMIIVKGA